MFCGVFRTRRAAASQKVEDALGYRIVMAVAASAHRVHEIVVFESGRPGTDPDLLTIGVRQHLLLGFAPPHCHAQSLQYDIGCLAALHCPADQPAGMKINDDCEIGETPEVRI